MKILAHRGLWYQKSEHNTELAFQRALDGGFGIETDFRDFQGNLVVSHDPVTSPSLKIEPFLEKYGKAVPLAVNVKADGISSSLSQALRHQGVTELFCFDMSVPETMRYLDVGLPVFARVSEYESPSILLERSQGIWLDYFHTDGWTPSQVLQWLDSGLSVCIVSPELHGREPKACWETIRSSLPTNSNRLMLCTDFPEEFRDGSVTSPGRPN